MIYIIVIFYILPGLFVLDYGMAILKQIRLEMEDHKIPLGLLVGLIFLTIFPVINLLLVGLGINALWEDIEVRDLYIKYSKVGQFFNIRI